MVQAGVLKPEPQQQELVLQLSALLRQLQDYVDELVSYRVECRAYEVRPPRCEA